ncbi:DEKNAAC102021 [Brettanomyces naardenensis]|uniref:DEKNAAC102021 n=1 Tax=Brettanomyces naardenensis TaxID=13370 RepID=A0A448YJE4_BRENA|nr:DEKNAAC102021 [Brettanomyces naardenensis]
MSLDYQSFLNGGLLHDRYVRVEGINEGSFGIVSLARDTLNNDSLVALKYNTGRLEDFEAFEQKEAKSSYANAKIEHPDVDKSFVLKETYKEVNMLRKVGKHPNIAQLLETFDTYIVLEYVARGDLHDAIQLGIAPVSTRDVVDVFMQLVSAIEHCHRFGVYHRDIKPENILIAEDWSIKLTDFGLATDSLWCTDFDVGSERYMAPELLEHSDIASYRADKVDLWSMGICLLNIVFGKSPFSSATSKDKLFLYFAANRETLFDIFPTMSYDLFGVLRHSLTIDPENRDLEQMKESLLKVEVLTYDYEFEEGEEEEAERERQEEIEKEPATPVSIPSPQLKVSEKPDELGKYVVKSAPEESALTTKMKEMKRGETGVRFTEAKLSSVDGKEPEASAIYTVPKGRHRFPHYRKPLKIPTVTRHRNRSQTGRVIKTNGEPQEGGFPFAREDFFTPRSVVNHYMEKTTQYRNFDHRARKQNQQYYEHGADDYNGGRAWRKRKNQRSYPSNKYRAGNKVNGRRKNYNSGRNYFRGVRSSSFEPETRGKYIPIKEAIPTYSRSYKQRSQNFSSPSGKYVPPNMRYRPPTPVPLISVHPEPELEPPAEENEENEENEEDELFMFEEAGKGNEGRKGSHVDYLSKKLADFNLDTAVEGNLSLSAPRDKYVPPHHRRKSSQSSRPILPKKYNIPHSLGHVMPREQDRVISSSVPTKNTNWFMQHYQPHNQEKRNPNRDSLLDYGNQDMADYVSEGFGLSYINGEDEGTRKIHLKRRPYL